MTKLIHKLIAFAAIVAAMTPLTSCDNSKSYAELLEEETKSVNAFLANHRVIGSIPADSVFQTVAEYGDDAPYYRMDDEGMLYMQVVKAGDRKNNKAKPDELIYFRFTRYNINYWYNSGQTSSAWIGEGNADDLNYAATSFRFGNYTLSSSAQYGSGIQVPLMYLGIDCEVNLVIKSQLGFAGEIANVIPYLYNVRYFKSQV